MNNIADKGSIMPKRYVKCINASGRWITQGKVYEVIDSSDVHTHVINDQNQPDVFYSHRFEECDATSMLENIFIPVNNKEEFDAAYGLLLEMGYFDKDNACWSPEVKSVMGSIEINVGIFPSMYADWDNHHNAYKRYNLKPKVIYSLVEQVKLYKFGDCTLTKEEVKSKIAVLQKLIEE